MDSPELLALTRHVRDPVGQAARLPPNPWSSSSYQEHPAIAKNHVKVIPSIFHKQNGRVSLQVWPFLRVLANDVDTERPNKPEELGDECVIALNFHLMCAYSTPALNGAPPGLAGDVYLDLSTKPPTVWLCTGDSWTRLLNLKACSPVIHPLVHSSYLYGDEHHGITWRSHTYLIEKGALRENPERELGRREPKWLCNLEDMFTRAAKCPRILAAAMTVKKGPLLDSVPPPPSSLPTSTALRFATSSFANSVPSRRVASNPFPVTVPSASDPPPRIPRSISASQPTNSVLSLSKDQNESVHNFTLRPKGTQGVKRKYLGTLELDSAAPDHALDSQPNKKVARLEDLQRPPPVIANSALPEERMSLSEKMARMNQKAPSCHTQADQTRRDVQHIDPAAYSTPPSNQTPYFSASREPDPTNAFETLRELSESQENKAIAIAVDICREALDYHLAQRRQAEIRLIPIVLARDAAEQRSLKLEADLKRLSQDKTAESTQAKKLYESAKRHQKEHREQKARNKKLQQELELLKKQVDDDHKVVPDTSSDGGTCLGSDNDVTPVEVGGGSIQRSSVKSETMKTNRVPVPHSRDYDEEGSDDDVIVTSGPAPFVANGKQEQVQFTLTRVISITSSEGEEEDSEEEEAEGNGPCRGADQLRNMDTVTKVEQNLIRPDSIGDAYPVNDDWGSSSQNGKGRYGAMLVSQEDNLGSARVSDNDSGDDESSSDDSDFGELERGRWDRLLAPL